MRAYVVRGDNILSSQNISLPSNNERYNVLNKSQFKEVCKILLKDLVFDYIYQAELNITQETSYKLNEFFNSIPEELIEFETDMHKKVLLKYIVSNIRYAYNIILPEDKLYLLIDNLSK